MGGIIMVVYLVAAILVVVMTAAAMAVVLAVLWRRLREDESMKREFASIIAHKFRTPLTHIKWSADNLIMSETDPYSKRSLSDIKESNEKLIKLTGTLLELTDSDDAAVASYKLEHLDISSLARAAVEVSRKALHEKNLFLSIECSEPEIFVRADRSRMEFVLAALLDNACLYSPPGRDVSVAVSAGSGEAVISVTDNGIGMAPADVSRVFTKFFRSKEARAADSEGFGVSLYLAQSVVRRHGGRIDASSKGPGKGSTFSVVLPRVN
jgi:signal transduction histidine kinase